MTDNRCLYFSTHIIIFILVDFDSLAYISCFNSVIYGTFFVLLPVQDFIISWMVKMLSLPLNFTTFKNYLDLTILLTQVLYIFATNFFLSAQQKTTVIQQQAGKILYVGVSRVA